MSDGAAPMHRYKFLQTLSARTPDALVALLRSIKVLIHVEQFVSNPDGTHTAYFTSDRRIRFRERSRNGNPGQP